MEEFVILGAVRTFQGLIVQERVPYLDSLRFLAVCAVVLLHVSCYGIYTYNVHSIDWNICNVVNSATRWCVPVFVMLSGALMLDRDYSIRDLWKKKIFHIVVVYLVWSLGYALIFSKGDVNNFINYVMDGHYHLWYLKMIVGVYAVQPILRRIVQSEKLLKYYVFVFFVVVVLLPFLTSILPIHLLGLSSCLKLSEFIGEFGSVKMVVGYSGYYVLGYCLSRGHADGKRPLLYGLGLISWVAMIAMTWLLSARQESLDPVFYDFFSIMTFFESVAVFLLIKCNILKRGVGANVSALVFGVYLVHPAVLSKVAGLSAGLDNPLIWIPLQCIGTVLVSFAVAFVMNRNRLLKKILL